MAPETVARLKALGLTQRRFADLTGTAFESVSRWDRAPSRAAAGGAVPEPGWVAPLLAAWEALTEAGQPMPWKRSAW